MLFCWANPGAEYDEIQRYDLETSPDMTAGPDAVNRILTVLEKENVACISLHIEETAYRAGEEPGLLTLICRTAAGTIQIITGLRTRGTERRWAFRNPAC